VPRTRYAPNGEGLNNETDDDAEEPEKIIDIVDEHMPVKSHLAHAVDGTVMTSRSTVMVGGLPAARQGV
jgi:hypothetical protein